MKGNGHATPEAAERDAELARAQVHSTIDAIASKLTPGQLMDQSLGYLKRSLPAEFTTQLGQTVRANPLPVTLVGVGLAWLMMSGRRAAEPAGVGERGGSVGWDDARDDFGLPLQAGAASSASKPSAAERLGARAGDVAQTTRERAAQATGATRDAVQHVRQGLTQAGQRLGDTARRAGERLGDTAHQAGQRWSETAGRAGQQLGVLGERSRVQAERARAAASRLADEQPLVLAALGVAVGAVIGALLPSTRREDAWMGDKRDELLGSARGTLREQAGQLREPAERVMAHARDELSQAARRMGVAASRDGAAASAGSAATGSGAGGPAWATRSSRVASPAGTAPAGAASSADEPRRAASTEPSPSWPRDRMYEGDSLVHSADPIGGPYGMGAAADDAARAGEGLSHSTAETERQPRIVPGGPDDKTQAPGGRKDIAG